MPRPARLLVPFALAALLAAGCGDDGADALSEDEFVEQANEICDEGNAELEAEAGELFAEGVEPSDDDLRAYADVFEENLLGQMEAVGGLGAPDDIADEVGDVIAESQEIVRELADQVRADPQAMFADQDNPFEGVNERLVALGLSSCAT